MSTLFFTSVGRVSPLGHLGQCLVTEAAGEPRLSTPICRTQCTLFAKNSSFFGLSILESQVSHLCWHLQFAAQDSEGKEGSCEPLMRILQAERLPLAVVYKAGGIPSIQLPSAEAMQHQLLQTTASCSLTLTPACL